MYKHHINQLIYVPIILLFLLVAPSYSSYNIFDNSVYSKPQKSFNNINIFKPIIWCDSSELNIKQFNISDYIDYLVDLASSEEVYNAREWDVLMLYKENAFMKKRSLVDDDKFFFAKNGKKNPKAELVATIKAIFTDPKKSDNLSNSSYNEIDINSSKYSSNDMYGDNQSQNTINNDNNDNYTQNDINSSKYSSKDIYNDNQSQNTINNINNDNYTQNDIGSDIENDNYDGNSRNYIQKSIADDDHPICRFPSRTRFIVENLGVDESLLPEVNCASYDGYMEKLDPTSITAVFPFLYLENPASIFGHVLIRINGKENEPLLGYGVSYTALEAENANIFMQFFGGFTGYYEGYFSVNKFYVSTFKYSSVEKRDIWEYDLNFTKEETRKVADHLWEMQNININYFFLDENCSYHLLLLLESARPELRLANSLVIEIPSDTIRVIKDNNLIDDINFRPSHQKVVYAIASKLPSKAVKLAESVADNKTDITAITEGDYTDLEKVSILDLAYEIYRYKIIDSDSDVNPYEYKDRTLYLLGERSKYRLRNDYSIDEGTRPDQGHSLIRLTASAGLYNESVYTELGFRLGFHSLEDIDIGFIPNSRVAFFDINLRYNITDNFFNVKDATFLSFGSYSPINSFRKGVSFKFDIGGEERSYSNYNDYFTPYVSGGAGVTFLLDKNIYLFIVSDSDLSFGSPYEYYVGLGLGANVGVSFTYDFIKLLIIGEYLIYPFNDPIASNGYAQRTSGTISVTGAISRNNSLMLSYKYAYEFGKKNSDLELQWSFFF